MMDHYYTKKPKSRFSTEEINVNLRDQSYKITTGSGIFSRKKVDLGTSVLIDNVSIEEGWDILDLGCGYGVVGITIARAFPDTKVMMTDINERAVKLARRNSKGLNNIETVSGDTFEKIDKMFDTILLNPPQNAGKDLCFRMIEESREHLKEGGVLQLVARHQKGGKSLEKHMKEVFGNVKQLVKQSGFRIYASYNS